VSVTSLATSVILSAASALSTSCEDIFLSATKAFHRSMQITMTSSEEGRQLADFAHAACMTSNPDVLWRIGATESSLRPRIARDNDTGKIYVGHKAIVATASALSTGRSNNIDVGILQINVRAHGKRMQDLGLYPINPYSQVKYIVDHMMPELTRKCGDFNWVGCYHSWSSKPRASSYQTLVKSREASLMKSIREVVRIRSEAASNKRRTPSETPRNLQ
jgi:hypothetical protein